MTTLENTNPLVGPLLTDMYQISMTYAHWRNRRFNDKSVFDLFFRKSPFGGEFCIVAGTDEVVRFLASYRFTDSDLEYLRRLMPHCEEEFFTWLRTLDCSEVKVWALREGSAVFPREPILRVEGPLAICQLLETTLLNLINFPSLVTTNAARMRLAAGPDKVLLEFGLRRAQGPDGGLTASKCAYLGGFDGTSNVLAGKLFGMDVKGTHAHAYVMCYSDLTQLQNTTIRLPSSTPTSSYTSSSPPPEIEAEAVSATSPPPPPAEEVEFLARVLHYRELLGYTTSNEGELAAFIAYAQSFPNNFLALIDTYDTIKSGVRNFVAVGLALHELGYKPRGIRLDSGDLAYLSRQVRDIFIEVDARMGQQVFTKAMIVASNDINEEVLVSLTRQGHEIDSFGIGTHLVTCQRQPALGCVFKLVEINGNPRIKLSQDAEKLVLPCKKNLYRLYGSDGQALIDLMTLANEEAPKVGQRVRCRHPFQAQKRADVVPARVEEILELIWDGPSGGLQEVFSSRSLEDAKAHCKEQIDKLRKDIIRQTNPTPYKVSVSEELFKYMHELWLREAPIDTLS